MAYLLWVFKAREGGFWEVCVAVSKDTGFWRLALARRQLSRVVSWCGERHSGLVARFVETSIFKKSRALVGVLLQRVGGSLWQEFCLLEWRDGGNKIFYVCDVTISLLFSTCILHVGVEQSSSVRTQIGWTLVRLTVVPQRSVHKIPPPRGYFDGRRRAGSHVFQHLMASTGGGNVLLIKYFASSLSPTCI